MKCGKLNVGMELEIGDPAALKISYLSAVSMQSLFFCRFFAIFQGKGALSGDS